MVLAFRAVHQHYEVVAPSCPWITRPGADRRQHGAGAGRRPPHGVVRALRYAQSLSPNPRAVFVEVDPSWTSRLEERWSKGGCGVPLIVLPRPTGRCSAPAAVHQSDSATGAQFGGHHRHPGIRAAPLVAAPAAQPDGASRQGRAAVSPRRRRGGRAVPSGGVTASIPSLLSRRGPLSFPLM